MPENLLDDVSGALLARAIRVAVAVVNARTRPRPRPRPLRRPRSRPLRALQAAQPSSTAWWAWSRESRRPTTRYRSERLGQRVNTGAMRAMGAGVLTRHVGSWRR